MAIDVSTTYLTNSDRTFSDATGWHVDDKGYLHITEAGKGNAATFHADVWVSVERVRESHAPSVINIHTTADPIATAKQVADKIAKLTA